jgi:hypothetical protein
MRNEDKQALKDWEAHKRSIENATVINSDESYADKKKRIDELKKDIEAFAKYYFPHYCQTDFGDFHKRFFKRAINSERAWLTNPWSRDHAKSVITDVVTVIFKKCIGETRNLILVSHNETNACDLLKPLKLEFESNLRLINDFGPFVNPGNWEDGKFITLDGCSFRALGAGQSPRGSRNQEARPDTIIVDDIDTEEVCRNPKRLHELWEWVSGALYGCFSIQGKKLFVVVGNIIGKDCIVKRAMNQSDFFEQVDILTKSKPDSTIIAHYKKLLREAKEASEQRVLKECVNYAQLGYKPTWHQRFSLYDCVYMITKMGYRMSQREYFNNPLVEGKVFKKDWIQFKKLPELKTYQYLLAYLDPGFKKTATSDSKSLILIGLINGEFHVRKVFCGKASVEEMVEWGYAMDAFVKSRSGSYRFKMEEVFLQSLLYKDFAAAAEKKGYPLPVSGDTRKKPDKDARIEATSGYFERGSIFFDEDIKEEHHTNALIEQLLNFEPGVKTLKDGPDALEGGIFLLQESRSLLSESYYGKYSKNNKHKV